jgi:hypothetical protein
MADLIRLRARIGHRPDQRRVVFDDATGPEWLAARWSGEDSVEFTIGSAAANGVDTTFRLAAGDALELVRLIVDGLDRPADPAGPTAPVLALHPRN